MKTQTFGIEIETTGIGRRRTAEAIARYFGTTARYVGERHDNWVVTIWNASLSSLMPKPPVQMCPNYINVHSAMQKLRLIMRNPCLKPPCRNLLISSLILQN